MNRLASFPLAALALAGCAAGRAGDAGPSVPSPALPADLGPPGPGEALDPFTFPGLDGNSVCWDPVRSALEASGAARPVAALILHVFQPDCPACRAQALELEALARKPPSRDLRVVGLAYRGDSSAAGEFARETGVSYPIGIATGSDWARRWGRGDPLYVVDREGNVAYAQVGFANGDVSIWRKVVSDVAAGREPTRRGPERKSIAVGDPLPAIALPDLFTGRAIELSGGPEGLVFRDAGGSVRRWRAAIGFFSRY